MVPRPIAPAAALRSFNVGIRPVTLAWTISRVDTCSRLRMISPNPNTPMATTTKPMPSESSGMPKLMRSAPVSRSEPTIDIIRPESTMAIALSTDPFASTTAKIRPSTMSEKYSAGPNSSRSEERRVGKECRSLCDWSSDVCSSDLEHHGDRLKHRPLREHDGENQAEHHEREIFRRAEQQQIGRASCRERV